MTCLNEGDLPLPPRPGAFRTGTPIEEVDDGPDDELDEAELERLAQLLEGLDEQAMRALFEEYLRQKGVGEEED